LEIKDSSNEQSTPENDIADLGDYSLFVQGISNHMESYGLDQRHQTEKIADTFVEQDNQKNYKTAEF
jgi:hypothetical protein